MGNTSEKLTTQGPTNVINQLGLFYTFSSLRPTRETTGIALQHHFSLYAYHLQDHTYFLPLYDGYTHMTDGDLFYDYENYKEVYEGRKGFAMMCRYDISFFTRKKRLNIINAFVSFQQGFRLMDRITLEVNYENGASLSAYSRTNGSYFSIGIAKPISIYPNKWLHLKKKNP